MKGMKLLFDILIKLLYICYMLQFNKILINNIQNIGGYSRVCSQLDCSRFLREFHPEPFLSDYIEKNSKSGGNPNRLSMLQIHFIILFIPVLAMSKLTTSDLICDMIIG